MSSTPFIPTPPWLDPLSEIKDPDQPPEYVRLGSVDRAIAFIMNSLRGILGSSTEITNASAVEVIANAVGETGWGRYHRGRNFGGWKISRPDVDRAKAAGRKCPPWWKALGHVNSGDAPFVYYRGFPSVGRFYTEWLDRFVPRNSVPSHRYHKTGLVFWGLEPGDWFLELCKAGYKGEVTQANPAGSVANHHTIVTSVRTRIVQHLLGVVPDGVWGSKSDLAAKKRQGDLGLVQTGTPSPELFEKLVGAWELAGMPVSVSL